LHRKRKVGGIVHMKLTLTMAGRHIIAFVTVRRITMLAGNRGLHSKRE
jgi:hypothetical protein